MPLQILRVAPPGPPRPIPARERFTGNAAADWFENVSRPDRFDRKEIEVAAELRRNLVEWESADGQFLRNADFEFDFLAGLQWIDEYGDRRDAARDLERKGRSAFTIDLLTPSVELVVNQIRINKTTATFIPQGGFADRIGAEVRQGLYRNIERVSKAAIARETAYQMAVSVGRGYERILIEDEEGASFYKKITIQRVDSLQSVAIDPTCLDFTYSDAAWAYTFDDLWKDEFRATYGTNEDETERDLDTLGISLLEDSAKQFWFPKDKVKVGEYWRRVWKMREVWRCDDGNTYWKEEVPPGVGLADVPINVKKKLDSTLEWRRMTGTQTLEKRIWPGKLIPIVVFIGREVFRGRKPKIHSGMVRAAMAPCRIHNYMVSRTVDEVALSPLPHMFAPEESFSVEQARIVNDINSHPWSIIYYTPKMDDQGRQLAPPQWASPSPNISAVVQATAGAKDDLQRVLNTYAPQLGQEQGKQSGTAINQIKESGDISHAAFSDNFNRAMLHEAAIVNELMDVVYTEPQAITITDPDERTRQVLINQEYIDKRSGRKMKHLFGIDAKYGVTIGTGQSYPTRQLEAASRILDLAKAMPEEVAKVMDLLVQDLNIPNAQKYADRWRPLGFTDDEEGPDITQVTQQRDQALQLANQAHGLITQLLQKVEELGNKDAIERLKIASTERRAAGSDMAGIIESEIKAGQAADLAALNGRIEGILAELDKASDVQLQAAAPPPGTDQEQGSPPAASGAPATPAAQPQGPASPGGAQPPASGLSAQPLPDLTSPPESQQ
jgi:Phage P22-like portal protein